MSKKFIFLVIFVFVFSCWFQVAKAAVIVNEIKYSPTSSQWVEIFNDTDSDVDITAYKILDSGASTNGHSISAVNGSNIIPAHSFGIVAKVPSDFSSISFPLFKSSLGIKVSGDNVILRNDQKVDNNPVQIDGSAVDGNSFQLTSDGTWKACTPTPGSATETSCGVVESNDDNNNSSDSDSNVNNNTTGDNTNSDADNENTDNDSSDGGGTSSNANYSSSSSSSATSTKKTKSLPFKVSIATKTLAFIRQPSEFQGSATGNSGEKLSSGKLFWNFGDGSTTEQINDFSKIKHTYLYAGSYVVSLEYYSNASSLEPDATSKITIKVIPLTISISKVGDANDFFIELTNNSSYEMNISNFYLASNGKTFIFPKNSVILAKSKMIIPGEFTKFTPGDEKSLKLFSPAGELVFDYGLTITPVIPITSTVSIEKISENKKENINSKSVSETMNSAPIKNNSSQDVPSVSNIELPASALLGVESSDSKNSKISVAIFAGLIGAGVSSVYFLRRRRITKKSGEDFEILDE